LDIYIAGTKQTLLSQLQNAIEQIKTQPDGMVSHTVVAEANLVSGPTVHLVFTDEDMENVEGGANKILVEVDA
jgi:hypothetical protein